MPQGQVITSLVALLTAQHLHVTTPHGIRISRNLQKLAVKGNHRPCFPADERFHEASQGVNIRGSREGSAAHPPSLQPCSLLVTLGTTHVNSASTCVAERGVWYETRAAGSESELHAVRRAPPLCQARRIPSRCRDQKNGLCREEITHTY